MKYVDAAKAADKIKEAFNISMCDLVDVFVEIPKEDVQPLSVVAEHIKNRLYETAFNTDEAVARDAIADMAERIDFWINELKDGEDNA